MIAKDLLQELQNKIPELTKNWNKFLEEKDSLEEITRNALLTELEADAHAAGCEAYSLAFELGLFEEEIQRTKAREEIQKKEDAE